MADEAPGMAATGQAPISVTVDGVTTTFRSVADMIMADRYTKASAAARNGSGKHGVRFTKLTGPQQCPTGAALVDQFGEDGSFS